jgi:hypothetical protein
MDTAHAPCKPTHAKQRIFAARAGVMRANLPRTPNLKTQIYFSRKTIPTFLPSSGRGASFLTRKRVVPFTQSRTV